MSHCPSRRRFVSALALAASAAALPGLVFAAPAAPRRLRFHYTHTSEKLELVSANELADPAP